MKKLLKSNKVVTLTGVALVGLKDLLKCLKLLEKIGGKIIIMEQMKK